MVESHVDNFESACLEFAGGFYLTLIYSNKQKLSKRKILYRKESNEIILTKKSGKIDCIDCHALKLLKIGKDSQDFEKLYEITKQCLPNLCLTIYYGTEFKLKSLSIIFSEANAFKTVYTVVKSIIYDIKPSYCQKLKQLILRSDVIPITDLDLDEDTIEEFLLNVWQSWDIKILLILYLNSLSINNDNLHFKIIGPAILINSSVDNIKYVYDKAFFDINHSILKENTITVKISQFMIKLFAEQNGIYEENSTVYQDMNHPLSHYWINTSHNTYLTGDQIASESTSDAYISAIKLMGCRCVEIDCWDGVSLKTLCQGAAQNPVKIDLINRALKALNLWTEDNNILMEDLNNCSSNNNNNLKTPFTINASNCLIPIVYHGMTLTSKISLINVILAIKQVAFSQTSYPLILSIEDHCSLYQMKIMGALFKECFGDMILTEPLSNNIGNNNREYLPSPASLMNKILIKHPTLPSSNTARHLKESVLRQRVKNVEFIKRDLLKLKRHGIVYIKKYEKELLKGIDSSPLKYSAWTPVLFLLTTSSLYYCQNLVKAFDYFNLWKNRESYLNQAKNNILTLNPNKLKDEESTISSQTKESEWLYTNLKNPRKDSESIIKLHFEKLGDGCFLVRNSGIFIGDYILTLYQQGKIYHCRIHNLCENGKILYYLNQSHTFSSLKELITYYQQQPMSIKLFKIRLTNPIISTPSNNVSSTISNHQNSCGRLNASTPDKLPYYFPNMSQKAAEIVLKKYNICGAFLLRCCSTQYQNTNYKYTLSFLTATKDIKHCRIKAAVNKEASALTYSIFHHEYAHLHEMIEHLRAQPFFESTKLTDYITPEVADRYLVKESEFEYQNKELNICHTNEDNDNTYITSSEVYKPSTLIVQATEDYKAKKSDELSFKKYAIITNVNKVDDVWWKGDYNESKQGWFPFSSVKELDTYSAPFDNKNDESLDASTNLVGTCEEDDNIDDEESVLTTLIDLITIHMNLAHCQIDTNFDLNDLSSIFCKPGPIDEINLDYCVRVYEAPIIQTNGSRTNGMEMFLGCPSQNELNEWLRDITASIICAKEMEKIGLQKEHDFGIAKEMSDLVVYTKPVPFSLQVKRKYYEISSLSEIKAESLTASVSGKNCSNYNSTKKEKREKNNSKGHLSLNHQSLSLNDSNINILTKKKKTPKPPCKATMSNPLTHLDVDTLNNNLQNGDLKTIPCNTNTIHKRNARFALYHDQHLTRIYPKAQRIDSSNFNPIQFWMHGCQLVALNFQNPDIPMQINQGFFKQNGGCGYVLKPEYMRQNSLFDPYEKNNSLFNPICLSLTIICGNHLSSADVIDKTLFSTTFLKNKWLHLTNNTTHLVKSTISKSRWKINKMFRKFNNNNNGNFECDVSQKLSGGQYCPYVEVEIYGSPFDAHRAKTCICADNTFFPFWNEKVFDAINIYNPEMCVIRFSAHFLDDFGDMHFIGQNCLPVGKNLLKTGLRNVPLINEFGNAKDLSSILVYLEYSPM